MYSLNTEILILLHILAQSEDLNGPTSIDNNLNGVITYGQTMAVGSNYVSGFMNGALAYYYEPDAPYVNNYIIHVNGSVSLTPAPIAAVPLPATAWLFASALAVFTSIRRKKI